MAMRGLEGEELLNNLRQLIYSFEPYIREAGSAEQAEETLLHLEENDENFHKHEFVKNLKRRLDELVSPLIDDELEKYSTAGHIDTGSQETLVTRITKSITQSKQFTDLKQKLKKNIDEASSQLVNHFEDEFGSERMGQEHWVEHSKPILGLEDEEGSVMVFDTNYLKSITDNLGRTKNLTTRREAMQKLNKIITGDIFNNDHWPQLKKNLTDIMADPDDELTNLSLKFLAKSYSCTSHHTCEIYIAHVEYLRGQFLTRENSIPSVKNGLNCTAPLNHKLIRAFYLMNQFQQETPNYWVRYPTPYRDKVIDHMLSLLAVQQPSSQGRMTPLHFVAVVDPRAKWFVKWMHGNYSRSDLLKALEDKRIIIELALKHCLDFSAARKLQPEGLGEVTDALAKVSVADGCRLYFTAAELDYAYFIHSLFFLSRILAFTNGRKFFPVKLRDKQGTVSMSQLIKALVLLVVDPGVTTPHRPSTSAYETATVVTEVLKELYSNEQACELCLCRDDIMSTLLSPIAQFLDDSSDGISPSESTLLHVADILCVLASSTRGRRYLMYGESQTIFSRTKSSAAHLIAEFTKKALMKNLPQVSEPPSHTVIGAYLYVCRQLYNTCEGLLVLYPYELHTCVAQAWREASQAAERAATPTPADSRAEDSSKSIKDYNILFWEDTLRDNLLNFASTAKGILLLQQTGAMNECVSYMYQRYEKKLQVSKCEKFGYGYMLTQVAATAPGMMALHNTGYLAALLMELWSSLECGPEDAMLFLPTVWPVDPIDRGSLKHFTRLVNVLSAFPAVYEVLKGRALPTKDHYTFRDIPDTIPGLLDRLVIMDSPEKIHSLFNFEQSHCLGLKLLSVMVSCLDTYLLLQSQYKFEKVLLTAQSQNKTEGRDEVIVDVLSVERNYILVKCHLLGGPSERIMPPRSLLQGKDSVYPFPLFSSFPVPREYIPNLTGRSTMKQETELTKFLSTKGDKRGAAWLDKCRVLFAKMLTTKPDQTKGAVLQQLLDEGVTALTHIPTEAIFPQLEFSGTDSAVKQYKLTPLQELGVETAIRYGKHLKVINSSSDARDSLTHLIRQTAIFLKQQQKAVKTSLSCMDGPYPGFDWLVATVFLVFHGNQDRAWTFLQRLSCLGCSAYLWPARMHASVHLPAALLCSGIPPVFSSTAHNVELILQVEEPITLSAFKMSGYTPAQICVHWLKQCFWNYLDWADIVQYLSLVMVMGVDYQVYVCVAVLRHLRQAIVQHHQTQDLVVLLKEEPIRGFHIAEQLPYLKELEKRHRKTVLSDMMNITKP
ncbi:protein broad-minded-like isoform X2 [Babylonia areolata]|uniref:protein broad-minded-like isoform X2 n=1 Tax=Babylonia areolata TaxID=304850 RepID=UPI003FD0760C